MLAELRANKERDPGGRGRVEARAAIQLSAPGVSRDQSSANKSWPQFRRRGSSKPSGEGLPEAHRYPWQYPGRILLADFWPIFVVTA